MNTRNNYQLVSACLVGFKCRYDCKSKNNLDLIKLLKTDKLLPICPEQLGGLSTPRPAAEIIKNKVITKNGKDVTENYLNGAKQAIEFVENLQIKRAYLKSKSPMCGCGKIYDGSFSGKLIKGNGLLTQLLLDMEIEIIPID